MCSPTAPRSPCAPVGPPAPVSAWGATSQRRRHRRTSRPPQAEELEGYAEGEENKIEAAIKAIAATGARVVVTGATVGEMALHFLEKYNLMARPTLPPPRGRAELRGACYIPISLKRIPHRGASRRCHALLA